MTKLVGGYVEAKNDERFEGDSFDDESPMDPAWLQRRLERRDINIGEAARRGIPWAIRRQAARIRPRRRPRRDTTLRVAPCVRSSPQPSRLHEEEPPEALVLTRDELDVLIDVFHTLNEWYEEGT